MYYVITETQPDTYTVFGYIYVLYSNTGRVLVRFLAVYTLFGETLRWEKITKINGEVFCLVLRYSGKVT
jgi:hypothetical protein